MDSARMLCWLLLSVCVAPRAGSAQPVVPDEEVSAPYLKPQQTAGMGNGRTINVVCLGRGSPTVILSAGMGGWSLDWALVQPALAARTKVCAWDRAGAGFSSPSPEPQDTVHTTQDLERALEAAAIEGPYVMVGHSLGAYESLWFTDRHRGRVAGMVLVDPDLPDRPAIDQRLAPRFAALSRVLEDQDVKRKLDCAAQLQAGKLESGSTEFQTCTAPPVPAFFPALRAQMARLNTDPDRLRTQASLAREHYNSSRQASNPRRRYDDMPLIVLTAGLNEASVLSSISRLPAGTPGAGTPAELAQLREQIARFLREGWSAAHESYAALSTRGRHQLVPDSTHTIATNKPEVVIAAINTVLDEVQAPAVSR